MEKFSIDILGHCWNVLYEEEKEDERLGGCSGFTDWTDRSIHIKRLPEDTNLANPMKYLEKVLLHEMVHAHMFESGLGDDWTHEATGHEELTVDWIAYHLVDMTTLCLHAMRRLECIVKDDEHDRD